MNNSTIASSISEDSFASNFNIYCIYICQGLFLMIANVLIFGSIVFHEPLRQRKEYIIIAGLAFIDIGQGFGFFTAGLIRNIYILEGTAGYFVSRLACLIKPWNITFMWSDPLSHIFPLAISIDRFIAVKFPLKYFKFTNHYSYFLVGGTYLFMFINVFFGILFTIPYNFSEVAQICFTEAAFVTAYYQYYSWLSIAGDFLSIGLYAVVIYLSFKLTKVNNNGSQRISAVQNKAMSIQRKVTRTLGICSICTFLFDCVPLLARMFLEPYLDGVMDLLIPYTAVVSNLNPMCNFFIFTIRQRDLRFGVKNFLKCNKLTESALQAAATGGRSVEMQSRQIRTNTIGVQPWSENINVAS